MPNEDKQNFQNFQEGDPLGGPSQIQRQIQDLFVRALVVTGRLVDAEPEDVAEVMATPEKSEKFHKEVLEAMSGLDEMEENLEQAVEEAKKEMEEQEEEEEEE